jgi:hypothetical protein
MLDLAMSITRELEDFNLDFEELIGVLNFAADLSFFTMVFVPTVCFLILIVVCLSFICGKIVDELSFVFMILVWVELLH